MYETFMHIYDKYAFMQKTPQSLKVSCCNLIKAQKKTIVNTKTCLNCVFNSKNIE